MIDQTETKTDEIPAGWHKAGSHPHDYRVWTESDSAVGEGRCACMELSAEKSDGFSTLMQSVVAGSYRGQRVRLSGWLKSEDLKWGALWMRVDGEARRMLAFDNMQPRPVTGTTPWTKYDIVLDVPPSAESLNFGFLSSGPGRVWADALQIDVVGPDVPTTDLGGDRGPHDAPANLGFDE